MLEVTEVTSWNHNCTLAPGKNHEYHYVEHKTVTEAS